MRKMNSSRSFHRALAAVLAVLIVSTACLMPAGVYAAGTSPYNSLEDFEGKRIGVPVGTIADVAVEQNIKNPQLVYFNTFADELMGLSEGKCDAFIIDELTQYAVFKDRPDLTVCKEPVQDATVGVLFNKGPEGQDLCAKFNAFLAEIRADGRYDALRAKWYNVNYDSAEVVSLSTLPNVNGSVVVFTEQTIPPSDFVKDGVVTGLDIELVRMFLESQGLAAEQQCSDVLGCVQAVASGKAAIAVGNINITEERKKQVLFSEPYASNAVVLVVKASEASGTAGNSESQEDGFSALGTAFRKTFIDEQRWQLYLVGLGNTLLITALAVVLGSVLAVLFCVMVRSRKRWAVGIYNVCNKLSGGIPVLVFLMVLFYIVFAKVNMPGTVVAAIGFSIYFGIDMGGVLKNSLDTVPKGQWEVCHDMGMTRTQSLRYVILPQIASVALPQYKQQIVSLLKGTSIVGYITVQDLTRMSDIIRSRTFDALFPLLAASVLYFVVVWIIIAIFDKIELMRDAEHRIPKLGGVVLSELQDNERNLNSLHHEFTKVPGDVDEPIITLEHVRKEYGSVVPLADVNETIQRGDVISIIGPSGTGKSTLVRLIDGLEPVTSGRIVVHGKEVTASEAGAAEATRRINMVFQQFNLFPHLTVLENVMLNPVVCKGVSVQDAYDNAMHLLTTVGLHSKAFNYPAQLSGGQQQRVAIVRALAANPEVIVFDEPTSALDPKSVDEVLLILKRLRSAGMTMLIVTHDMHVAYEASTRVFYMDEGIIFEEGTPQQVFDDPQRKNTRQFVHQLKVWKATLRERDFDMISLMTSLVFFMKQNEVGTPMANAVQAELDAWIDQICMLLPKDSPIYLEVEYTAKEHQAKLYISYGGNERDLLQEFTSEARDQVEFFGGDITFKYDGANEYVIRCNPHEELFTQANS